MSFKHINQVRDHSKTEGAARLLLWAIASRTDENGRAFPSRRCLARDTAMHERSIVRALKGIPSSELEVIKGGSQKGGKRQATHYCILLTGNPSTGANPAPVVKETTSEKDDTTGDHRPPVRKETTGDKSGKTTGDKYGTTGDKSGKRPVTDGHPNRQLTDKRTEKANRNGNSPSPALVEPKKKAFVPSNKLKAKTEMPWKLSDDELEELQERYGCLGDVRQFLREATQKCRQKYPDGGPMRADWFREYLGKLKSDLPPPGFTEGQRLKQEEMAATRDRAVLDAIVEPLAAGMKATEPKKPTPPVHAPKEIPKPPKPKPEPELEPFADFVATQEKHFPKLNVQKLLAEHIAEFGECSDKKSRKVFVNRLLTANR